MTGSELRAKWRDHETANRGWIFTDPDVADTCVADLRAHAPKGWGVRKQKRIVKSNTFELPVWAVTVRKRS